MRRSLTRAGRLPEGSRVATRARIHGPSRRHDHSGSRQRPLRWTDARAVHSEPSTGRRSFCCRSARRRCLTGASARGGKSRRRRGGAFPEVRRLLTPHAGPRRRRICSPTRRYSRDAHGCRLRLPAAWRALDVTRWREDRRANEYRQLFFPARHRERSRVVRDLSSRQGHRAAATRRPSPRIARNSFA